MWMYDQVTWTCKNGHQLPIEPIEPAVIAAAPERTKSRRPVPAFLYGLAGGAVVAAVDLILRVLT